MPGLDACCGEIQVLFDKHAGDDGLLSKDELKKMIDEGIENPKIREKLTKEDLNMVMGRMDKDKDGSIDFLEFCKFVCFVAKCQHRHEHKKK